MLSMCAAVCLCLGVGALLPGAPPQLPLPWGQARPGRALVVDGRSLGGPTPGQQGASLQSSSASWGFLSVWRPFWIIL